MKFTNILMISASCACEITSMTNKLITQVALPGSKSITNRALLIASLTNQKCLIKNALFSDDTKYMVEALKKTGFHLLKKGNDIVCYGNRNAKPQKLTKLYLGNAGTAVRFLTAKTAFTGHFPTIIDGNDRMRERPIQNLISALQQLGSDCHCIKNNNCPPVLIKKACKGGICTLAGNKSSQYLSALLLSGCYSEITVEINIEGALTSKPYVDITLDLINKCGVKINNKGYKKFIIKAGQEYTAKSITVEADASSGTYFGALACLNGGQIHISNLNLRSKQADIRFFELIKYMGCQIKSNKNGFSIKGAEILKPLGKINVNDMPDGAMTLAILCAFAKGKSHLYGLHTLRIKETDRLKALAHELNKIGCTVKETKDGLIIDGNPKKLHGAEIETYNDHRIAMSFAIVGTKIPGILIKNPSCVNKTYPNFWKDLKKIGIKIIQR